MKPKKSSTNHTLMLCSMRVSHAFMPRFNANRVSYKEQERLITTLCAVLKELKTPANMKNFLKDILNRQERIMIIRRLLIADRLLRGKTYVQIHEELGAGTTTIARVDRWLHFGRGGYRRAIDALRRNL